MKDILCTDSIREFCHFINHAEQDISVYRNRIYDSNRKLLALLEQKPKEDATRRD
jgi:hypothetical protein